MTNAILNLSGDNLSEINKFLFYAYERMEAKKDPLGFKSAKLFPLHQELLAKGSIGLMHRSMFTTKKGKKADKED